MKRAPVLFLLAAVMLITAGRAAWKAFAAGQTGKAPPEPCLRFQDARDFSEGLAAVKLGAKWGYVDRSGKMAVAARFDAAHPFSDGLAAVRAGASWGYIDRNGSFAIPLRAQANPGCPFWGGLASVPIGEPWGYIDRTGRKVIQHTPGGKIAGNDALLRWLADIGQSTDWADLDKSGKALIVLGGLGCYRGFSEGLAAVQQGERWGFIDGAGKFAVQPRFDSAGSFSEGLAVVKDGGKWGFADKGGRTAIPARYDIEWPAFSRFSEGLAAVKNGGKFGYLDKTGKFAIRPHFEQAHPFSEGYAAVKLGNDIVFIDRRGQTVMKPPRFGQIGTRFREALLNIQAGGKWGYIDRTGQFAVPPQYAAARPFFEGLAAVRVGAEWSYIDRGGRCLGGR